MSLEIDEVTYKLLESAGLGAVGLGDLHGKILLLDLPGPHKMPHGWFHEIQIVLWPQNSPQAAGSLQVIVATCYKKSFSPAMRLLEAVVSTEQAKTIVENFCRVVR